MYLCKPYFIINDSKKGNIHRKSVRSTDIVLKVRQPSPEEVALFKDGGSLISFMYPAQNKDLLNQLAAKKLTVFGECVSAFPGYPR